MRENNFQPRILYPLKIFYRNKGEIKIFSDEEILREFVASRSSLRMAKGEWLNKKEIILKKNFGISERKTEWGE